MTAVAYGAAFPASRGVLGRTYSPSAVQYFTRAPSLPASWKDAYAAFIDGLVADGVWAQLDALHVLAGPDQTAANVNLVQPSYGMTPINAPAWTRKSGYTGGASKYLSTGFTPSTAGGKWSLNSACLFAWSPVDVGADNNLIRTNNAAGATGETEINLDRAGGFVYWNANTAAYAGTAVASAVGFWLLNRPASTNQRMLCNSSLIGSNSTPPTSLATTPVVALAWPALGRYTALQASITGWGAGLTTTQEASLYSRCNTIISRIGVLL